MDEWMNLVAEYIELIEVVACRCHIGPNYLTYNTDCQQHTFKGQYYYQYVLSMLVFIAGYALLLLLLSYEVVEKYFF